MVTRAYIDIWGCTRDRLLSEKATETREAGEHIKCFLLSVLAKMQHGR